MKKLRPFFLLVVLGIAAMGGIFSCAGGGYLTVSEDGTVLFSLKAGIQELAVILEDSYWDYLDVSGGEGQAKRLAVLTFVDGNGKKTDIGRDIANSLQVEMHDPELFTMLERERMDSLLEEYKFSKTGMVEEISAAELGKLLGAELVLVGTVTQTSYTTVISKIVDLQTGEILAIGEINLTDLSEAKELDT